MDDHLGREEVGKGRRRNLQHNRRSRVFMEVEGKGRIIGLQQGDLCSLLKAQESPHIYFNQN